MVPSTARLSVGPPNPDPRVTWCRQGAPRSFSRFVLDAADLIVSKPLAAMCWASLSFVVTASVIVANGHDAVLLLVGKGALAAFVSFGVTIGAVAIFGLTPWERRLHWRTYCMPWTDGDPDTFQITLESKHFHTARNLRCLVVAPPTATTGTGWYSTRDHPFTLFSPGDTATLAFPQNFPDHGLPHAGPAPHGGYVIEWQMEAENGIAPVTLIKTRYDYKGPGVLPPA